MKASLLWILVATAMTGCYRTHYVNFVPPPIDAQGARAEQRELRSIPGGYSTKNGWQHFYVWGWVPSKRTYAVDVICGGADRIESIQTQRTFVQGLIATFAGYYVNVYSPYNAAFNCQGEP